MSQHPARLNKKGKEEGRKHLEVARTKEINDEGKWLYRVRGPPWAKKIVLTNENGTVDDIVYECPLGKSDHSAPIVTFKCIQKYPIIDCYTAHGDYKGIKAKLDHTNWGETLGTSTINDQWLGFKEYIKKIEDKFIPHRLVSNINRHKWKVPHNKESVKKIKKNTLYGSTTWREKKENTILNIVGLEIKSLN